MERLEALRLVAFGVEDRTNATCPISLLVFRNVLSELSYWMRQTVRVAIRRFLGLETQPGLLECLGHCVPIANYPRLKFTTGNSDEHS